MSARWGGGTIEGCSPAESYLCHELADTYVRCAAGVICGIKPLALFTFGQRCVSRAKHDLFTLNQLDELLDIYTSELRRRGIGLARVSKLAPRTAIATWSIEALAELLTDPPRSTFLRRSGLDVSSPEALAATAVNRLRVWYDADAEKRGSFPHELGVLFGYPLSDVEGFMRHEQATCRGPWVAFGDERQVRERFRLMASREGGCRSIYRAGASLGELLSA